MKKELKDYSNLLQRLRLPVSTKLPSGISPEQFIKNYIDILDHQREVGIRLGKENLPKISDSLRKQVMGLEEYSISEELVIATPTQDNIVSTFDLILNEKPKEEPQSSTEEDLPKEEIANYYNSLNEEQKVEFVSSAGKLSKSERMKFVKQRVSDLKNKP